MNNQKVRFVNVGEYLPIKKGTKTPNNYIYDSAD